MVSDEDRIRIGRHARQILEDEVFDASFKAEEASIFEKWMSTDPTDVETREALYFEHRGLRGAKKRLTIAMERGTVAEKALEEEKRERQDGGSSTTG